MATFRIWLKNILELTKFKKKIGFEIILREVGYFKEDYERSNV